MASNNNLQTPPRRLSQHPLPSPALHPLRDALPHATPAPGDYNPFEDAFDDDDENEGEEALFLGFDCSTQALKCSLLDSSLDVLGELEVRFDRDLPQYQTTNGVLMGEKGSGEVYSPVLMCVHAMDLLLDKMARAQWPLSRIKAVSGAGQQHASVYWNKEATTLLGKLSPDHPLHEQLSGAFSRPNIPNWQDSSTSEQCHRMEEYIGGGQKLADITGSRAHERFTGPQIMRFREVDPEAYANTDRVSLVSSFLTTLLCADGEIKGIDESDACGMNLWDMSTPERGWNERLLQFVSGESEEKASEHGGAKELARKLGTVESDAGRVVGRIGKWYQAKGFSDDCIVCPATGDNPATFLSFTLGDSEAIVSLGTSDTVLISTQSYAPSAEWHTFAHPAQIPPATAQERAAGRKGGHEEFKYFSMLVYKNGSLAREHVRDEHCNGSWDEFNKAVSSSSHPSPETLPDRTGFYWLKPEIIPSDAQGIRKYVGRDAKSAKLVDEFDSPQDNALAILQSQFLNYRSRSSDILSKEQTKSATSTDGEIEAQEVEDLRLKRVFAVGGAAANPKICEVMADVLGAPICKPVIELDATQEGGTDAGPRRRNADYNSCSVAAAYKAKWAYMRHRASPHAESASRGSPKSKTSRDAGSGDEISFQSVIKDAKQLRSLRRAMRARVSGADKRAQPRKGKELDDEGVATVASPHEERAKAYASAVKWWSTLEDRAIRGV